jgi:hypothetical protein
VNVCNQGNQGSHGNKGNNRKSVHRNIGNNGNYLNVIIIKSVVAVNYKVVKIVLRSLCKISGIFVGF